MQDQWRKWAWQNRAVKRRTVLQVGGAATVGAVAATASASRGAEAVTASETNTPAESTTVEILTDEYNVSHIYAESSYALFFGQGYDAAGDRLWQMDALRQGAIGDDTLRTLYAAYDGEDDELVQMFLDAPPEAQEMFQAYAAGVNKRIEERIANDALPAEYEVVLDGQEPMPWSPIDTLAIVADLFNFRNGAEELDNAELFAKLYDEFDEDMEAAYEALEDIQWLEVRDEHTTTIPEEDKTVDGGEQVLPYEDVPQEQLEFALKAIDEQSFDPEVTPETTRGDDRPYTLADMGLTPEEVKPKSGSYGLAIGGEHTETGDSMVIAGPQLGFSKPPITHQVGLHGAGYDVAGFAFPGLPGIAIGRTKNIAWAINNGMEDKIDTVALDYREENDTPQYQLDGEWHDLEETPGPGYWRAERMPVEGWLPEEDKILVERYAHKDEEMDFWYNVVKFGQAESVDAFEDRVDGRQYAYHLTCADSDTIAYYAVGQIPQRKADEIDVRLPVHDDEYIWDYDDVLVTLEERDTYIRDPQQGYLVSWNNGAAKGWRAGTTEQRMGASHEVDVMDYLVADRIEQTDSEIDWEVLNDINESISRGFRTGTVALLPPIVDAIRNEGGDELQPVADELEDWNDDEWTFDTEEGTHHPGVAIWEELLDTLEAVLLEPTLGDSAGDLRSRIQPSIFLDIIEQRTNHDWLGGESPDERIVEAVSTVADELEDAFESSNPADWRLPEQTESFGPLGVAIEDEMPIQSRGTYNMVVTLGQGLDQSIHGTGPGNSGYISLSEFEDMQGADDPREAEPDRVSNQLESYASFEMIPHAITRDDVEDIAETTEMLLEVDVGFTLENVGTEAWGLTEATAGVGRLYQSDNEDTYNPTLSLAVGDRYRIENDGWDTHSLAFTDENGDPLLTQDGEGAFEDDGTVAWVDDGGVVEFTLTQALADSLDGYECTEHGDMAGSVEVVAELGPPQLDVAFDGPPQSVQDDGLFDDVRGDGELTIADVQALFETLRTDAVQNNASAFNFAGLGDDRVSVFDVQALYTRSQQD